jgi:ComF family protein
VIDSLLNFIFPVACILCGTPVLDRRNSAVCPDCWTSLSPITPPFCLRCGMPAIAIEGACGRCRAEENLFDLARSAVFFNDSAREIVHRLKYSDRVSLARPIGKLLREIMGSEGFSGEMVVPVPLHRTRQRERGFNQAELIARELGIPLATQLVRRRKKTATQTGLSRSERAKNLSAAFEVQGNVQGLRIILVDDVLTTGATVNAMTRSLKRAGAERVEVLTFARVPDAISPPQEPWEHPR